jgi:hypothetical protein
MATTSDELAKLGDLLDRGLITRDEFNRLKQDLLAAGDIGSREAVSPYQVMQETPVLESPIPNISDQFGQEQRRASVVLESDRPQPARKDGRPIVWITAAVVAVAAIGIGTLLVLSARDGRRPTAAQNVAHEACANDGDLASTKTVLAGAANFTTSQQAEVVASMVKECPSWTKAIGEGLTPADIGDGTPTTDSSTATSGFQASDLTPIALSERRPWVRKMFEFWLDGNGLNLASDLAGLDDTFFQDLADKFCAEYLSSGLPMEQYLGGLEPVIQRAVDSGALHLDAGEVRAFYFDLMAFNCRDAIKL